MQAEPSARPRDQVVSGPLRDPTSSNVLGPPVFLAIQGRPGPTMASSGMNLLLLGRSGPPFRPPEAETQTMPRLCGHSSRRRDAQGLAKAGNGSEDLSSETTKSSHQVQLRARGFAEFPPSFAASSALPTLTRSPGGRVIQPIHQLREGCTAPHGVGSISRVMNIRLPPQSGPS
jgi:hypothetical protein